MLEPCWQAQPHMAAGAALYEQGDLAEAKRSFESALAVQADLSPAKFNLAVIYREEEENETAERLFREVIASGDILAESFNNLGILAVRRERYDEGARHFREAIHCRHDFPLAHFNLGTLLLRLGHWREGWQEYEWRWQTPGFTPVECPQPRWNGEPLQGTLLLHTEQGIGDVFQFCRFIPQIRERCERVIFLRPESMDCMFPVEHWADEVRSPGEIQLDAFQAVLPLMSAPQALNATPETLPLAQNYLTPVVRTVELPQSRPNRPRKVGITWGGSPTHANDAFRSIAIREFLPLFQIPEIDFYSLQVGTRAQKLSDLGNAASDVHDLSQVQADFADTAAIVRQLDLVITVDTSLLHLAGGLGVPTWGLLSRRSDWRWMGTEQTETPWYPTVRLFRQRTLNDWSELMKRVAAELKH